jgi:hypothetical protein
MEMNGKFVIPSDHFEQFFVVAIKNPTRDNLFSGLFGQSPGPRKEERGHFLINVPSSEDLHSCDHTILPLYASCAEREENLLHP